MEKLKVPNWHLKERSRPASKISPYAFTEHGAIMAANVLSSPHAVQMYTTCGDAVGSTALVAW